MPVEERRNYKGVFDAVSRTASEEGVTALWKGAVPTMARATALNVAMMVSNDTAKEMLTARMGKDSPMTVNMSAALISAVCTAVGSLPFDNVKTKMQKQKPDASGKLPYASIGDCVSKSMAKEGVTGFWAGLPTYYFRVGPHAIIVLLASEQYKKLLGVGKS